MGKNKIKTKKWIQGSSVFSSLQILFWRTVLWELSWNTVSEWWEMGWEGEDVHLFLAVMPHNPRSSVRTWRRAKKGSKLNELWTRASFWNRVPFLSWFAPGKERGCVSSICSQLSKAWETETPLSTTIRWSPCQPKAHYLNSVTACAADIMDLQKCWPCV